MLSNKIIFCIFTQAFLLFADGAPTVNVGQVLFTEGAITVNATRVETSVPIFSGSAIQTGPGGQATLSIGQGHIVSLDSGSTLNLLKSNGVITASLSSGQMRGAMQMNSAVGSTDKFVVKTPSGAITLDAGRYVVGVVTTGTDNKVSVLTLDQPAKMSVGTTKDSAVTIPTNTVVTVGGTSSNASVSQQVVSVNSAQEKYSSPAAIAPAVPSRNTASSSPAEVSNTTPPSTDIPLPGAIAINKPIGGSPPGVDPTQPPKNVNLSVTLHLK